ncbi:MAG: hypothetical protein Q9187_001204 [Circinaria calcarea]
MASASLYPASSSSPSSAHYNLEAAYEDPVATYARTMHQHTKRQMDAATLSASRRRSAEQEGVSAMTQLTTQSSADSANSTSTS